MNIFYIFKIDFLEVIKHIPTPVQCVKHWLRLTLGTQPLFAQKQRLM
jgi:hypothetical protein